MKNHQFHSSTRHGQTHSAGLSVAIKVEPLHKLEEANIKNQAVEGGLKEKLTLQLHALPIKKVKGEGATAVHEQRWILKSPKSIGTNRKFSVKETQTHFTLIATDCSIGPNCLNQNCTP